jgi:hypothetical protein
MNFHGEGCDSAMELVAHEFKGSGEIDVYFPDRAYQSIKVVESRAGMCDFGGALRQIQV